MTTSKKNMYQHKTSLYNENSLPKLYKNTSTSWENLRYLIDTIKLQNKAVTHIISACQTW